MSINEVVNTYKELRSNLSVAKAASETMSRCSITSSDLVATFNAVLLDLSKTEEETAVNHGHRNELLSHFNAHTPSGDEHA